MHPAAHGYLYQIPNPGFGTQDCEGICSPFPLGNYPEIHESQCLVFCHYRPLCSTFFVPCWSALYLLSAVLSPGSLMELWPSKLIINGSQLSFPKMWKRLSGASSITLVQINDKLVPLLTLIIVWKEILLSYTVSFARIWLFHGGSMLI